jgi:asparagine synthase (glutamine-hydrolysing)
MLAGLSSYVSESEKETLVFASGRDGLQTVSRHFGDSYEILSDIDALSRRITRNHFDVSLPSNMLRKVDVMSMRAGIEVRVPMLDEELVDLALSLPHRMKTDGRMGKLVLRDVAARWLPSQVASHPKHGFTIPLDIMVRPKFHQALSDLLEADSARTAGFLEPQVVRGWLEQFRAAARGSTGGKISREGLYLRILMVLALELWLRDHGLVW